MVMTAPDKRVDYSEGLIGKRVDYSEGLIGKLDHKGRSAGPKFCKPTPQCRDYHI